MNRRTSRRRSNRPRRRRSNRPRQSRRFSSPIKKSLRLQKIAAPKFIDIGDVERESRKNKKKKGRYDSDDDFYDAHDTEDSYSPSPSKYYDVNDTESPNTPSEADIDKIISKMAKMKINSPHNKKNDFLEDIRNRRHALKHRRSPVKRISPKREALNLIKKQKVNLKKRKSPVKSPKRKSPTNTDESPVSPMELDEIEVFKPNRKLGGKSYKTIDMSDIIEQKKLGQYDILESARKIVPSKPRYYDNDDW